MPAFYDSDVIDPIQRVLSNHDDSIDELASLMLNETALQQLTGHPGQRLSQHAVCKVSSRSPGTAKAPLLKGCHSTSPGDINLLNNDMCELKSTHNLLVATSRNQEGILAANQRTLSKREDSAPAIPHRSSRRRSIRAVKTIDALRNETSAGSHLVDALPRPQEMTPRRVHNNLGSTPLSAATALDIGKKIQEMMAETERLKPVEGIVRGPSNPPKRTFKMKSNMFAKVKHAISGRFQERANKKRRDSVRDEPLLDKGLNGSSAENYEVVVDTSPMDIRLNEGMLHCAFRQA